MTNHRFRISSALFVMLGILVLASLASAQTSRGSVSGTVTDQHDAVVSGAKVDLINKSTGVLRTTQTNEVGVYRFDAVDLGDYDLKISTSGFKDFSSKGIGIVANRTATIDAKQVANLPIASLNPIALARTLPGVTLASGSSTFGNGGSATQFAVNGQR